MDLSKLDTKENVLRYQKVMAGSVDYYNLTLSEQKSFLRTQEKVKEARKSKARDKRLMDLRKKGLYGYRRII